MLARHLRVSGWRMTASNMRSWAGTDGPCQHCALRVRCLRERSRSTCDRGGRSCLGESPAEPMIGLSGGPSLAAAPTRRAIGTAPTLDSEEIQKRAARSAEASRPSDERPRAHSEKQPAANRCTIARAHASSRNSHRAHRLTTRDATQPPPSLGAGNWLICLYRTQN